MIIRSATRDRKATDQRLPRHLLAPRGKTIATLLALVFLAWSSRTGRAGSLDGSVPVAADPAGPGPVVSEPFTDPFGSSPAEAGGGLADPFADPFGDAEVAVNWDSVFAAYDRELPRGTLEPLVGVRYGKVEGLHLEGGVDVRPPSFERLQGVIRAGYDLGRERPIVLARVRMGDVRRGRRWAEIEVSDGARPFGSHHPYGNTIFTLIDGYDAQSYLRDRGYRVRTHWSPRPTWVGDLEFAHREHSALRVTTDFHLLGSDEWMRHNETAERVRLNTIRMEVRRRPRYSKDVVRPGIYLRGSGELTGGEGLGGTREFSRVALEAKRIWQLHDDEDEFYVYGDAGVIPGRPPGQEWFDLGGAGGLRAFEPRQFVGTSRFLARAQYVWEDRVIRRSRIPFLEKLRFHLTPFVEVGSAWGGFVPQTDWDYPGAGQVHWDLGIGLRRVVASSGILSFVQLDLAWPMGSETAPARITMQLSSRGYD